MKLLIAYATTDGQTRKVARRAMDRLYEAGHSVELLNLADPAGVELGRFDAAILAGSMHIGGYQRELTDFVTDHSAELNRMPTLFLPVSLSAAGHNVSDWEGLGDRLNQFIESTGWKPGRIEHVAGAFRFSAYDAFRGWAMRRIAAERDPTLKRGEDREYTDWPALEALVTDWAAGLKAKQGATG
ncbi:flavodoxin domain-containing protein [Frigidibacter sp. ROC022]|uniref:flavodoxin domain-containing protein n=1 Tax=Frigidibacter sp. ROC022 TaxID=2971796 RepID=UPI00215B2D48|nr:flavodoxin domain-containing protein [Frigidibacter sp. ROC022]MCR8725224.1 protoporphyrinogen oxidase [Frigidibacter sp. ROC022]